MAGVSADADACTPRLFRLPTDVWILVSLHISHRDRAALSATHTFLLALVDSVLWRNVFQRASGLLLADRTREFHAQARQSGDSGRRSEWWYACRYLALLDTAWTGAQMAAFHAKIPLPQASHKRQQRQKSRYTPSNLCIPAIALSRQWLVIAARSHLFLLPADKATGPLDLEHVHKVQLNSRNAQSTEPPDPWQDITKVVALTASRLLVSFADGNVQVLQIQEADGQVTAQVECHIAATVHQEIMSISSLPADRLLVEATYEPVARDVIASLSKRGRLCIHLVQHGAGSTSVELSQQWQIRHDDEREPVLEPVGDVSPPDSGTETPPSRTRFRSSAFNNAPETGGVPNQSIRAWSVLLGSSPSRSADGGRFGWVAVGTTARDRAVQIYPLQLSDADISLGTPYAVSATGSISSVYAMAVPPSASPIPSFLLFVGYYDGVIRVYDTRGVDPLAEQSAPSYPPGYTPLRPRPPRRVLDPVAVFRHKFEGDPIYAFAFGGPSGTHLAIGDARHARVRLVDVSMLAHYDVPLLSAPASGQDAADTDWVAFAIPSSNSPNYGIVADADRIFGVTDQKLWSFDFGLPLEPHSRHPSTAALIDRAHAVSVTPSIRA